MNEIRTILEAASGATNPAPGELLPLVYDELRTLAARKMSGEGGCQTLQATALVHEAWLRLTGGDDRRWNDRTHFFRAAAQAMRHILVDRARSKASLKRGASGRKIDLHDIAVADASPDERVLLVDELMDRLEKEDPESARVITLKFFGGLTNREISAMEGVSERTIERQWSYAKTRLFQMIGEEKA